MLHLNFDVIKAMHLYLRRTCDRGFNPAPCLLNPTPTTQILKKRCFYATSLPKCRWNRAYKVLILIEVEEEVVANTSIRYFPFNTYTTFESNWWYFCISLQESFYMFFTSGCIHNIGSIFQKQSLMVMVLFPPIIKSYLINSYLRLTSLYVLRICIIVLVNYTTR